MPLAIAIRHVAFEDLGTFAAALERRGFALSYRDATVDDLDARDVAAAELLVVLGGPIGAYEEEVYPFLADELRVIERRLAAGKPVLGICLGAQLLARALGARVHPGDGKEIGWAPLVLSGAGRRSALAPLGDGAKVLHWHGDTFDLPPGAVHLAATERYRNQAFAFERHGLALQFHLEVTQRGLERWYIGHACEIGAVPGLSVAQLRADAERCAAPLAPIAARCLDAWLDGVR
jgi:GMP synthase (glutamine-hydrolysing)